MIPTPPTMIVPLQEDEQGAIRVSGTRITLDTIVNYFLQGRSPEALHESFPTVPLNDIYAVIAYYLAHREELNNYLKRREEEAKKIQQKIEAEYPPRVTRAALLARLDAKKNENDN